MPRTEKVQSDITRTQAYILFKAMVPEIIAVACMICFTAAPAIVSKWRGSNLF